MTRRLYSGNVAFTTTSASPRRRRSACGSVTSASIAWIAAVLPRDFKARERSPRLSAITISDKRGDRKSTRLNSSHVEISYAVFCLKKKKKKNNKQES